MFFGLAESSVGASSEDIEAGFMLRIDICLCAFRITFPCRMSLRVWWSIGVGYGCVECYCRFCVVFAGPG